MSKTSNSAKIDCLLAWIEDLKKNNKPRKKLLIKSADLFPFTGNKMMKST